MTSVHHAATRRNEYAQPTDQTLKLDGWSHPAFPAAELIERRTRRPMATCATLARLAGFHEVEAQ